VARSVRSEQDAVAEFVLDVIEARRFDQLIESEASIHLLDRMAQAARQNDRSRRSVSLKGRATQEFWAAFLNLPADRQQI
jgi:hypothetical protein